MFGTAFGFSTVREQARLVLVSVLAPLAGFYTPVKNFVLVVVIMFAFNIFAGMRADKVSIRRCRNFSMQKFREALGELLMYLLVMILVFTVMTLANDQNASLLVVKSLSYVFVYVYMQNGLRNMIICYPNVVVLHVLYHVIRLEFKRALPDRIKQVVERYEKENGDIVKEPEVCKKGKQSNKKGK